MSLFQKFFDSDKYKERLNFDPFQYNLLLERLHEVSGIAINQTITELDSYIDSKWVAFFIQYDILDTKESIKEIKIVRAFLNNINKVLEQLIEISNFDIYPTSKKEVYCQKCFSINNKKQQLCGSCGYKVNNYLEEEDDFKINGTTNYESVKVFLKEITLKCLRYKKSKEVILKMIDQLSLLEQFFEVMDDLLSNENYSEWNKHKKAIDLIINNDILIEKEYDKQKSSGVSEDEVSFLTFLALTQESSFSDRLNFQTSFITPSYLTTVLNQLSEGKHQSLKNKFKKEFSSPINPKHDELFEEAAKTVVIHQQGSTSLLQRKLKLGYNRVGRIIDQLEEAGIVSPFNGSKAREVYFDSIANLEQYLRTGEIPKNASIVTMPKLSDTMTSGKIDVWHKKVGDYVVEGELIAEIESDKATMEYESYHSGTILYLGANEGDSIKVDGILTIVGEKGADWRSLLDPNNIDTQKVIESDLELKQIYSLLTSLTSHWSGYENKYLSSILKSNIFQLKGDATVLQGYKQYLSTTSKVFEELIGVIEKELKSIEGTFFPNTYIPNQADIKVKDYPNGYFLESHADFKINGEVFTISVNESKIKGFIDSLTKLTEKLLIVNQVIEEKKQLCDKITQFCTEVSEIIENYNIQKWNSYANVIEILSQQCPNLSRALSAIHEVLKTNISIKEAICVGKMDVFWKKSIAIYLDIFKHSGLVVDQNYNLIDVTLRMLKVCAKIQPEFGEYRPSLFQPCEVHLIDRFENGTELLPFSDLPEQILKSGIITSDNEYNELIERLKLLGKRPFEVLKGKYSSVFEYNKVTDSKLPLHIVCIANFPEEFTEEQIKSLYLLAKSGYNCGVYFIISSNRINKVSTEIANLFDNLIKYDQSVTSFGQVQSSKMDDESIRDTLKQLDNYISNKRHISEVKQEALTISQQSTTQDGITIPVGKQEDGNVQEFKFEDGDHVFHSLVCGSTGSGKSVLLHQIILQGACKYAPEELKFLLLDFKEGTEFMIYEDLPHTEILSTVSDLAFGLKTLQYLEKEINKRSILFKKYKTSTIKDYRNQSGEVMDRKIIIIDEFQVLLSGNNNSYDCSKVLEGLVKQGRSFGIHIILATQTLADVDISKSTLSNIGIRVGMKMLLDDAARLFGFDNTVASEITEIGKGVYNNQGGNKNFNTLFKSAYLDRKNAIQLIEEINQSNQNFTGFRHVFHGNEELVLPAKNKKILLGEKREIGDGSVELSFSEEQSNGLNVFYKQIEPKSINVLAKQLMNQTAFNFYSFNLEIDKNSFDDISKLINHLNSSSEQAIIYLNKLDANDMKQDSDYDDTSSQTPNLIKQLHTLMTSNNGKYFVNVIADKNKGEDAYLDMDDYDFHILEQINTNFYLEGVDAWDLDSKIGFEIIPTNMGISRSF